MQRTSLHTQAILFVIVLASSLFVLAGCGISPRALLHYVDARLAEHEERLDRLEAPAVSAAPPVASTPQAMLEFAGFAEGNIPATLQILAEQRVLTMTLRSATPTTKTDLAIQPQLDAIYPAQTIYLDYALIYAGDANWTLYYGTSPTGVITPTTAQMHLTLASASGEMFFNSGPEFTIGSLRPIAPSQSPGQPIPLADAITAIQADMGRPIPPGQILAAPVSFLLVSDGADANPRRTLAPFLVWQPDGTRKPPAPGGDGDPYNYCSTCVDCAWWCFFF